MIIDIYEIDYKKNNQLIILSKGLQYVKPNNHLKASMNRDY